MKHTKMLIAFVLLFLVIGFATITTSLSINADMELLGDLDNFAIYYSRAVVNGQVNSSIIVSSTELDFGAALKEVGTPYVIEYDITNASSSFDAQIEMTCTGSTEYFEVSNVFDNSIPLEARQTRTGTLTLKKIKTLAGDAINSTVSCSVVATPIERNSEAVGTVPLPIEKKYFVGEEVTIGTEKFNVISTTLDTITLLAKYNLGSDYRQSPAASGVSFASTNGWEYTPGPKDIDIQTWSNTPKTYINAYIEYLKTELGTDSVTGNLITLTELASLGCVVPANYSWVSESTSRTCSGSLYEDWLINGQYWWTRSAKSNLSYDIWLVNTTGIIADNHYSLNNGGVRPTITVDKDVFVNSSYSGTYSIGQEVAIGTDKFNVISDNGDTVSMLAQYNLTRDNLQTPVQGKYTFNYSATWEYIDDYEIDISLFDGETTELLKSYVSFLQNELGDTTISGNLITLKQLGDLGCVISDDYSYTTAENCKESSNSSWLLTGQYWWTISEESSGGQIWYIDENGDLRPAYVDEENGVRPVITISKATLNGLQSTEMYEIGQVVSIGDDTFNVIKDNGNSLVLLSQEMVDDCGQTLGFSSSYSFEGYSDWGVPDEAFDIVVQSYDTSVYSVISSYEYYLESLNENSDLDVDLISLNQLGTLGCKISTNYTTGYDETCANSPHASWLVADATWWTKSVRADYSDTLWIVHNYDGSLSPESINEWCVLEPDEEENGCKDGVIYGNILNSSNAVRPVVTVSKEYVSSQ